MIQVGDYQLVLQKGLILVYQVDGNQRSLVKSFDIKDVNYEQEEFDKFVEKFKTAYIKYKK